MITAAIELLVKMATAAVELLVETEAAVEPLTSR